MKFLERAFSRLTVGLFDSQEPKKRVRTAPSGTRYPRKNRPDAGAECRITFATPMCIAALCKPSIFKREHSYTHARLVFLVLMPLSCVSHLLRLCALAIEV